MNEVRKLFVNFITAVKPRMNHPPKHHFYEILVGLWHWMIPNPEMLTSNTLHHLGSSVRLILARWRHGTRAEPLKAGFCSHSWWNWWNCLFSVAKVAQTIHVLLVHSLFFVAWTPKFACNKKQPCFLLTVPHSFRRTSSGRTSALLMAPSVTLLLLESWQCGVRSRAKPQRCLLEQ